MGNFWSNFKNYIKTDFFSTAKHDGVEFLKGVESLNSQEEYKTAGDRKRAEIAAESKVPAIWTQPDVNPVAILETPQKRIAQYKYYNYYYENDDIAHAAINALSQYIFCSGYELNSAYNSPEKPTWLPQQIFDDISAIPAFKDSAPEKATTDYVDMETKKILEDNLMLSANIDVLMIDEFLMGNLYLYLLYNWAPEKVKQVLNAQTVMEKKALVKEFEKSFGPFQIVGWKQLNPSAIRIQRDPYGEVENYVIVNDKNKEVAKLDPTNVLHLKLSVPEYITYGQALMQGALRPLIIKESLDTALKAFGDRFALPIKILQVGMTLKGQGGEEMPYISNELLNQAAQMLKYYDPTKGKNLVLPYFMSLSLLGTEGKQPRLEKLFEQLIFRILTALGIPEVLLTGDFKNFASAKTVLSVLTNKLNPIRLKFKHLLETKVTKRLAELRGWYDNNNELIYSKVEFNVIDIGSEESLRSLLLGLLQLKGQGVDAVSMRTVQDRLGFTPELEEVYLDEEYKKNQVKVRAEEKRNNKLNQDKMLRDPNADSGMRLPNDHKLSPKEKLDEESKRNTDHTKKHNANILESLMEDENFINTILEDPEKMLALEKEVEDLKASVEEMQDIIEDFEGKNDK